MKDQCETLDSEIELIIMDIMEVKEQPQAKSKRTRPYKLKDPKKLAETLRTCTITKTAQIMKVSKTTIYDWIDRLETEKVNEARVDNAFGYMLRSESMANLEMARKIRESISEEEIAGMKSGQKADLIDVLHRAHGITYDKYRLESGMSTANVANLSTIVSGMHHRLVFPPDTAKDVSVEVSSILPDKSSNTK